MENMNLDIYSNNQNAAVNTPDPVATYSALSAGNPAPTVTPLFIAQGMGPNGTANTMVTDIDSGIKVTKKVKSSKYSDIRPGISHIPRRYDLCVIFLKHYIKHKHKSTINHPSN